MGAELGKGIPYGRLHNYNYLILQAAILAIIYINKKELFLFK